MLVLTRKTDQEIVIADHIRVRVLEVRGSQVRLGIVAPKEIQRPPRRGASGRRLGTRDVVLRNSRTVRARLPVLHLEMSRSVPHTSIGFHGSASFTQTSGRSDRGQRIVAQALVR